MKVSGFTLVEILIALFIFAIMGVMVAFGLHSVINTHKHVSDLDNQLQRLEVAQTLLRRDVRQAVDRSVLDGQGHRIPAFYADDNESIAFTRGGVLNPFAMQRRSDLQRMGYACSDNKLIRTMWPVLDRVSTTEAQSTTLLTGISECSFELIGSLGQISKVWPLPTQASEAITSNASQQKSDLPAMVRVTFNLKKMGQVIDFIPIPSRGVNNNQDQ